MAILCFCPPDSLTPLSPVSVSYLLPLASPRYNSCTYFKKADAINCGRGGMVTDSITVNLWMNYATWDRPVSCTESGGWNFETSPVQFAIYIYGVGYLTSKNGYAKATAQPSANEWHMITGTYDRIAQTTSIYIDGELEGRAVCGIQRAARGM